MVRIGANTSFARRMSQAQPHLLSSLVARIADAAEVEPEARALQDPGKGPRDYLVALATAELFVDGIRVLAHLLPRREAVWWAWMNAQRHAGTKPPPKVAVALKAVETWIGSPTDDNRRAALQAGEEVLTSATGCAALAAYLSGNLAPPGAPEVPPPPYGTARAVIGSLLLAAVVAEPEKAPERHKQFLTDGLQLADRIKLWDALQRGPARASS